MPDIADALVATMPDYMRTPPNIDAMIERHMATPSPWVEMMANPPPIGPDTVWHRIEPDTHIGAGMAIDPAWRTAVIEPPLGPFTMDNEGVIHEGPTHTPRPAVGLEALAGEPLRDGVPPVRATLREGFNGNFRTGVIIIDEPIAERPVITDPARTEPNRLRTRVRQRPLSEKVLAAIAECGRPLPVEPTRENPFGDPRYEFVRTEDWTPITPEQARYVQSFDAGYEIRRVFDPADPANEQIWARPRQRVEGTYRTATEIRAEYQRHIDEERIRRTPAARRAGVRTAAEQAQHDQWFNAYREMERRHRINVLAADHRAHQDMHAAMLQGQPTRDVRHDAQNLGGPVPPAGTTAGNRGADNAEGGSFWRRMIGLDPR